MIRKIFSVLAFVSTLLLLGWLLWPKNNRPIFVQEFSTDPLDNGLGESPLDTRERPIIPFKPRNQPPPAPPVPPPEQPKPVPPPALRARVVEKPPPKPLPAGIVFYKKQAPEPPRPPLAFAPTGTMIPCRLVNALESSSLATPVLGLVTEDVWFNKKRIVPVGTEVHALATHRRIRNRIAVRGNWTLVWSDGKELTLGGIALQQVKTIRGWGPQDGSAGLPGELHEHDSWASLKLMLSSGLGAASRNARSGFFGSSREDNLTNALGEGLAGVSDRYANMVLDELEEGLFVKVPSGSPFYLYVTEPIVPGKARKGPIPVAQTEPAPEEKEPENDLESFYEKLLRSRASQFDPPQPQPKQTP